MDQYWIDRAMSAASAVGMLRGHLRGEMLHMDNNKSQFERMRDALERSYELYGDEMSAFDHGRIHQRALELGAKI